MCRTRTHTPFINATTPIKDIETPTTETKTKKKSAKCVCCVDVGKVVHGGQSCSNIMASIVYQFWNMKDFLRAQIGFNRKLNGKIKYVHDDDDDDGRWPMAVARRQWCWRHRTCDETKIVVKPAHSRYVMRLRVIYSLDCRVVVVQVCFSSSSTFELLKNLLNYHRHTHTHCICIFYSFSFHSTFEI